MKNIATYFYGAAVMAIMVIIGLSGNCSENLQEPIEQVPADTVHVHHDHEIVVTDSFHVHHDHTVVVIDTILQNAICDTVDIWIEWTVTGDESAPNIYLVYLNDVFYDQFLTEEFPFGLTEVKFELQFFRIVFGDVIRIEKSGSQADVISSAIVDIRCSGG